MEKKEMDVSSWVVAAVLVIGAVVLFATVAMFYQIDVGTYGGASIP